MHNWMTNRSFIFYGENIEFSSMRFDHLELASSRRYSDVLFRGSKPALCCVLSTPARVAKPVKRSNFA
ncbi:hypothetical protein F2P81_007380 [Scophthalmus maximus]|uniref:Uncharacterized protein n=1 Tax=Scophthalmus maximus TaxID=52904 RepID=A0A6A4TH94_SCOMX|nr:hypothetical protein F2P81_007380 [Scophthalmus maximus]